MLREGRALAPDLGDLRSEAHILYYLGRVTAKNGEYAQANEHYKESLFLFQVLDTYWGIAQAQNGLIHAAYAQNDHAEAKRLCESAIPLHEKIKARANTLDELRGVYRYVSEAD